MEIELGVPPLRVLAEGSTAGWEVAKDAMGMNSEVIHSVCFSVVAMTVDFE